MSSVIRKNMLKRQKCNFPQSGSLTFVITTQILEELNEISLHYFVKLIFFCFTLWRVSEHVQLHVASTERFLDVVDFIVSQSCCGGMLTSEEQLPETSSVSLSFFFFVLL